MDGMTVTRLLGHAGVVIALAFCRLTAAADHSVTYSKDVAPIFEDHCAVCHRSEQIAPMSLRTYAEARPWAKSILKKVTARDMPPFGAAGPIGRYRDDPRLTEKEIETIVAWVESGAQRGNPKDLPEMRQFESKEWFLGPPDLTLKFPNYSNRQEGKDEYARLFTGYVFDEDVWVNGVQLNPLNFSAIHHANIFIFLPGEEPPEGLVDNEFMDLKTIFKLPMLLAWTPGLNPTLLPEGEAIKIPKGSRLLMESHFAPTEAPVEEQFEIGLYFADGVVDPDGLKQVGSFMADLVIEPFDPHSVHTDHYEFEEDALVTHFTFHMHYRGKTCKIVFHYPDGTQQTAIDIPNWDFYWQQVYFLTEPMLVPKGTIAELFGVWDNSPANPLNPNPSKRVKWGIRTQDEMYGGSIYYSPANADPDSFITVSNGREIQD